MRYPQVPLELESDFSSPVINKLITTRIAPARTLSTYSAKTHDAGHDLGSEETAESLAGA